MESKQEKDLIFIRLFPGEEIYPSLREIGLKYRFKTAVVLSGIGQLARFELGFFKEKGSYLPQAFSEPHELLSLSGNFSLIKGDYKFHLHALLSGSQKQVKGGHFISGQVSVTAEIVLLTTHLPLKRKIEQATGLEGLFLE